MAQNPMQFRRELEVQLFSDYGAPERREISRATVQAFEAPIVSGPPYGFRGGLVLGDSGSDLRLRHSRYWRPVDTFRESSIRPKFLQGDYTLIGPYYAHFGHTMSEFVHRIIPSFEFGFPKKYLLVSDAYKSEKQEMKIPVFLKEIFYFMGIEETEVSILGCDAIIEKLLVCEQGSDFGGGPKRGYLNYLDRFTISRLESLVGAPWEIEKVYVSRSKLLHGGNYLGERYIEALLKIEGFSIVYPEEMTFVDQMQVYRSAEKLIFSEGSSCHGIEFFGNAALRECHVIERRKSHREIFTRIFRERSRKYSTLTDSVELPSVVLDRDGTQVIDYLSNCFFPARTLLEYFRRHNLAALGDFNIQEYYQCVMEDFDKHLWYHHKRGDNVLRDDKILEIRFLIDQIRSLDSYQGGGI